MPNANITADRFHVMKQVNDELDDMRKAEKRAAISLEDKSEKDRILEGFNKSKYSFIKTHIPHFKMQYTDVSNNITKASEISQY